MVKRKRSPEWTSEKEALFRRIQITDYLETLKTLNGLRKDQKVILDSVTRKVFFATDEYGKKKKYPDETIRKEEINRRLAESEEYRQREKEIERLEDEILKNKVEQEYLRNKIALNTVIWTSLNTVIEFTNTMFLFLRSPGRSLSDDNLYVRVCTFNLGGSGNLH